MIQSKNHIRVLNQSNVELRNQISRLKNSNKRSEKFVQKHQMLQMSYTKLYSKY